jgi:hypothetical protein
MWLAIMGKSDTSSFVLPHDWLQFQKHWEKLKRAEGTTMSLGQRTLTGVADQLHAL